MPNPVITPRALAVVLLASLGSEVSEVASFLIVLPEQLLIEAQQRAIAFAQQKGANLGLQYATRAVSQAVGGSNVDPLGPTKLFIQGLEALNNASSVEEAANKGTVALGALIL